MKKATCLLGMAVMLVCVPMLAVAGDYHTSASGIQCADCHVMHFSQSHNYDGTPAVGLGGAGPYHYLLRNEVNDLCLSCHDGVVWAPDVLGANAGFNVRQGGRLNRLGIEGDPNTGHTLDDNSTVAPGGAFVNTDGLNCTNCHHQHGYNPNGNSYRNLQHNPDGIVGAFPLPGVWVSYEIATTPSDTVDVMETARASYDIANVWFEEPDQTKSGYAQWCKACHTVFHGDKGSAEMGGATGTEWYRHPNADADIGDVGGGHSNLGLYVGSTNRVKVMNAGGNWASTDPLDLETATPSCFSCHKGHGNLNPFGLIFMSGTGTVSEEGDDGSLLNAVEDLCGQCHVQAPQSP